MNIIKEQQGGYSFTKGLERAKTRLAYYEEGLLVEIAARIIDTMERRGVTPRGWPKEDVPALRKPPTSCLRAFV